jgi:hypothetical protein
MRAFSKRSRVTEIAWVALPILAATSSRSTSTPPRDAIGLRTSRYPFDELRERAANSDHILSLTYVVPLSRSWTVILPPGSGLPAATPRPPHQLHLGPIPLGRGHAGDSRQLFPDHADVRRWLVERCSGALVPPLSEFPRLMRRASWSLAVHGDRVPAHTSRRLLHVRGAVAAFAPVPVNWLPDPLYVYLYVDIDLLPALSLEDVARYCVEAAVLENACELVCPPGACSEMTALATAPLTPSPAPDTP